MPIEPNKDIERETTGEPYVEADMETSQGLAPEGSSVEDLDPDSKDAADADADADDAANGPCNRGGDSTPDSPP
jgi:hypothetical protein